MRISNKSYPAKPEEGRGGMQSASSGKKNISHENNGRRQVRVQGCGGRWETEYSIKKEIPFCPLSTISRSNFVTEYIMNDWFHVPTGIPPLEGADSGLHRRSYSSQQVFGTSMAST